MTWLPDCFTAVCRVVPHAHMQARRLVDILWRPTCETQLLSPIAECLDVQRPVVQMVQLHKRYAQVTACISAMCTSAGGCRCCCLHGGEEAMQLWFKMLCCMFQQLMQAAGVPRNALRCIKHMHQTHASL